MKYRIVVPILVAAAILTLTACAPDGQSRPEPGIPIAPVSAPVRPSEPVSTSTPAPEPSRASGEPTAPASNTTAPAIGSKPVGCVPEQLEGVKGGGNGAAGTDYYDLILTNSSATTCTLEGYPKVQAVGDGNGTALGITSHSYWNWQAQNGNDTSGHPNQHVVLKPGAKAYVNVAVPSIYNYAKEYEKDKSVYEQEYFKQCGSAIKADGYRLYLPGESTSLFIEIKGGFPICSAPADNFIRTSEVVAKPTAG